MTGSSGTAILDPEDAALEAYERDARDLAPASDSGREAAGLPPGAQRQRPSRRPKWLGKLPFWGGLYLLLLPTILSMVVFSYYPKLDVFVKSAYEWTPGTTQEYVGANNFLRAFGDPIFWGAFQVVAIMLVANLFKMWPAIFTAVALHRVRSDRWRYAYQVGFVVPMIVPSMVWLLIWKSFYDPDLGLLNQFLNGTGLMSLLAWLDGTREAPGVMPRIAALLDPIRTGLVATVFGSVWALLYLGGTTLVSASNVPLVDDVRGERSPASRLAGAGLLVLAAAVLPLLGSMVVTGVSGAVMALAVVVVLGAVLHLAIGPIWILWGFLLLFGAWAVGDQPWRLPLLTGVALLVGEGVRLAKTQSGRLSARDWATRAGYVAIAAGCLLIALTMIWHQPTDQFVGGRPAWLGNANLVLPSLILWGFPWVGTFGVLIYLAGLQQIGTDVYEAADLDGVGPLGKLFRIELPLILTQVRINLIFMTIGTLTGYEFYLILLGPDGGPGNVGMVPGLYMYKSAFLDLQYGYACALGVTLFVLILLLTIVYNKYVKVDK